MNRQQKLVEVIASWNQLKAPTLAGILSYSPSPRGGVFSFEYAEQFLAYMTRDRSE